MRLSALGDVCLMVPLLRTVQRRLPQASVTWIISHSAHALLEGLSGVEFVILDKSRPLRGWLEFYRRMLPRKFDVLLAAQASWRANLLYPAIRARRKIGFDRERARDGQGWFVREHIPPGRQHLLESFLSFGRMLGITDPVIEWDLPVGLADREFARRALGARNQRWLAINPGASKPYRNWLPDRYAALMDHAWEKWQMRAVLTGGPGEAERQLAQSVLACARCRGEALNLVGRTTPKQLAAVLERAAVLVAPDTGPVHIATAMGTPVVGLYAVASPELSAPYLSRHLVVNRFPEAVREILREDPDRLPWRTRVHSPRAMELIDTSSVAARLAAALGK